MLPTSVTFQKERNILIYYLYFLWFSIIMLQISYAL
jgi:hypothetical protein